MSNFVKQGNTFKVIPDGALDIRNQLPIGTYTVNFNPMTGEYSLVSIPDLRVNHKLYGNIQQRAERVLNTFMHREGGTGILLLGRKGTGKTMLSKRISEIARGLGILTIIINEAHSGEGFNRFLSDITQPCVIIFDEFEKVYKREAQNELLTLFDGVYPTKKLFIVTSNEKNQLSPYMMGRPGRLFYRWEYKGIPEAEIREYLTDNIEDKSRVDEVLSLTMFIQELSYDILKAVVEEVNRYPGISAREIIDPLNIESGGENYPWRVIELDIKSQPVKIKVGDLLEKGQSINPIQDGIDLRVDLKKAKKIDYPFVSFDPKNIVSFNRDIIVFKNGEDSVIIKKAPRENMGRFGVIPDNPSLDDDDDDDNFAKVAGSPISD